MAGGAPLGNKNGQKFRMWEDTLKRVLTQDPNKLRQIAEKVIEAAANGESWAVTEIGNRLDGKPAQSVAVTHEGDAKDARDYSEAELLTIISQKKTPAPNRSLN